MLFVWLYRDFAGVHGDAIMDFDEYSIVLSAHNEPVTAVRGVHQCIRRQLIGYDQGVVENIGKFPLVNLVPRSPGLMAAMTCRA
jgi:hypothetical protein